jgi:hypothetical protein
MTILAKIKQNIERKSLVREYDRIRKEIDDLHAQIDTLSIKLGTSVRRKCEIEIELSREQ